MKLEVVRRYFAEVLDAGRSEIVSALFTPDCLIHRPEMELVGIEDFTRFVSAVPAVFSSFETTLHDIFESEDRVAVRLSHATTVRGTLRSRIGAHETPGKDVNWNALAIFRFEGGRIAEEWVMRDELGMLLSAEVLAPPPGT